jgi:L-rhamnose mutarotase
MLRHAFTMQLQPGAYAEYKRMHDEIWPELSAEIERCGVVTMSIFESGPEQLFLYSEARDAETWDKLRNSEVHQRWSRTLQPLFVTDEQGNAVLGEWNEMFTLGRAARDEE